VDLDRFVEDLGFVEKSLDRTYSDEGAVLGDFRHSAINDLVVLHGEYQGLESDVLVNRPIAVDNLPSAYCLVIEGEQGVVLVLVESSLKSVVSQFVDVLL